VTVIQTEFIHLFQSLNSKKTLPLDTLPITLRNLSEYLQCVPLDSLGPGAWSSAIQGIETLFRRLTLLLPNLEDAENLLDIMVSVLKIPAVSKVSSIGCFSVTFILN